MGLEQFSLLACLWIVGALSWSALVFAVATAAGARGREDWTSYWLVYVICAAVPPLLAPLFALMTLPVAPMQIDAALALANWTAPVQRSGLPSFLVILYLACAAALMLGILVGMWRLACAAARLSRLVRGATPAFEFGASRVLVSAEPAPACCVGGARPAIILPRGLLSSMTQEQLRMIVLHEAAHLHRRDPALFLVLHCLDILFWFNPFVRALTARTRLAAEIACDASALQAGGGKSAYAHAFVCAIDQQNASAPPAVAAFGDCGRGPRIRLAHILGGASRRRHAALSGAIVAAACVLCVSGAAFAASTGRMAVFGDSMLLAALHARATHVYGSPQCGPSAADTFTPIVSGDR